MATPAVAGRTPVRETSTAAATGRGVSEIFSHATYAEFPVMHRYPEVPELLEQFMEASGTAECWVTVRELRSFFQMDESAGPAFSGFLQRIHHGPFHSCRYRVARMEKFRDDTPPYRIIKKYLVETRPAPRHARPPYGKEEKNR